MIVCSKCGKENEPRFKFCLGCGSELTIPKPKSAKNVTPKTDPQQPQRPISPSPKNILSFPPEETSAGQGKTVPPSLAALNSIVCPTCKTTNPKDFTFCGNCGAQIKATGQQASSHTIRSSGSAPVQISPMARLVLVRPDGSDGGSHSLNKLSTIIGRGVGPLFDGDGFLSPNHLHIQIKEDQLEIEDAESLNGVFVRICADEQLEDGDVLRIGQELLRFNIIREPSPLDNGTEIFGSPNPGYWGRINMIVGQNNDGSSFPLIGDEMVIGRERGDILFPDDGYVSGTHAKISIQDDKVYLTDLQSSNGTFIRIKNSRIVPFGTYILMGQQLFRVDKVNG